MSKEWMLRTCSADMTSYGGFHWPTSGLVEAPDWERTLDCGNRLHGLLRGEGDWSCLDWSDSAKWLVCEIETDELVELDGEIKVPRANVIYAGDQKTAVEMMKERYPNAAVVGCSSIVGDRGTATVGDHGTAKAGDDGTATAGDRGTATAGDRGIAKAGDDGTATAGFRGTATAGFRGKARVGDFGTALAGFRGTATAGCHGTATASAGGIAMAGARGKARAGDYGFATAGDYGFASVGVGGKARAGANGTISIRYVFGSDIHTVTGRVCRNGIKPNTYYHVVDCELVEVGDE